jgi:hypothetical protein
MAMTTKSSISVNPFGLCIILLFSFIQGLAYFTRKLNRYQGKFAPAAKQYAGSINCG